MATVTKRGTGIIAAADYHAVKWVGKTKEGIALTIELPNALNKGDVDWTFAEKGETVAEVTFEGVYSEADMAAGVTTEPWTIETDDTQTAGATEIILNTGGFYIDDVLVGLTRGGGKFTTQRVVRDINADDDRGTVEGRVVIDEARPILTMNLLELVTRFSDLYAGIETVVV